MSETPATLAEMIDEVRGTPMARAFFKRLWQRPDYCSLFFQHRHILFMKEGDRDFSLTIPFLFIDNLSDDRTKADESRAPLVAFAESDEAEREVALETIEDAVSELPLDSKALAVFLAIRLVSRTPALQGLGPTDASFASLRQLVAQGGVDFKIFDEFIEMIEGSKKTSSSVARSDAVLVETIGKYFALFKRSMHDGIGTAANLVDLSTPLSSLYLVGRQHARKLLQAAQIPWEAYRRILFELHTDRLLTNLGTVLWCGWCHDDPFVLTTRSRVSPVHLQLGCPRCGKQLYFGSAYQLDGLLTEAAVSKDGLLAVAIGCLLEEGKREYETSVFEGDHETDFQVREGAARTIIEVKTFRTQGHDDAVVGNVASQVVQLAKQIEQAISGGKAVAAGMAVSNYTRADLEKAVPRLGADVAAKMKKHGISLWPAAELPGRFKKS